MLRIHSTLAVAAILAIFAGPSLADPAQIITTRSGETPRGATRVVFVVDRPVEFLTVELPSENGFEVHLLDVDGNSLPSILSPKNGLIGRVAFRSSPTGVVARLTGSPVRLAATTFPLENPHRVVVDLRPRSELDNGEGSRAKPLVAPAKPVRRLAAAKPTPVSKNEEPKETPENVADKAVAAINSAVKKLTGGGSSDPDPTPEPVAAAAKPQVAKNTPDKASDRSEASIFEDPAAQALASKDPGTENFEDLLVWIHMLQASVEALNEADNDTERSKYRRRLGYLLVQRGILVEGEKSLAAALASEAHNPETALADSVTLAEVRLQMGRLDEATDVARNLDTGKATPEERVRIASVLLDTENWVLAGNLLKQTVDDCDEPLRSRARLLLARTYWNRDEAKEARDQIRRVTASARTPKKILREAVLLHADCEFALGRNDEAHALYTRATALNLTDEDASWAGLQLGNLARRAGRHTDARNHWKHTTETWPDTFYGTQAAWFLRFSDDLHKLSQADAENLRG